MVDAKQASRIAFWLAAIGMVFMIVALTNNSWAYQETNGTQVTYAGLWKYCTTTPTAPFSCKTVTFPFSNCTVSISGQGSTTQGLLPQCSQFRAAGALAVCAAVFALLAALAIRMSVDAPGASKLRNVVLCLLSVCSGVASMVLWYTYFQNNLQLSPGGAGITAFQSGLGAGFTLLCIGWALLAVAAAVIIWFVPEAGDKFESNLTRLGVALAVLGAILIVVAMATPGWSQSEGQPGAVSSAGLGLIQICVFGADTSNCANIEPTMCQYNGTLNPGATIPVGPVLTGCRSYSAARSLQAVATISGIAAAIVLACSVSSRPTLKAVGVLLASVAGVSGLMAMALYKGWADENLPLPSGAASGLPFVLGYSFGLGILGWCFVLVAAAIIYVRVEGSKEPLFTPDSARRCGVVSTVLAILATLMVVVGLGTNSWAHGSIDISATVVGKYDMGFYQVCANPDPGKPTGSGGVCSAVDAQCNFPIPATAVSQTLTLSDCARINACRALTILTFFAGLPAVVCVLQGVRKRTEWNRRAGLYTNSVAAVLGYVAMGTWLQYFERNIETGVAAPGFPLPNPVLGYSFGLHTAGAVFFTIAAICAFVALSGPPPEAGAGGAGGAGGAAPQQGGGEGQSQEGKQPGTV